MFRCYNCGFDFDEPVIARDYHGFRRGPAEITNVCPYCRSNDFERFGTCDICDVSIPTKSLHYDAELRPATYFCSSCYEAEISKLF